ncbi:DUF4350 domain-containing protein [Kitasatospora sp. CMC57]|uniref:DUF4350 domain-containing protein n=1 Tax=Kitasatospora sp. CMC57 TaxID=3231513 RepID=A0AB33K8K2_9ACTN
MTTTSTPVDVFPGWAQLWRRSRWFAAAAVFVLLTALLISGLGGHREYPPLDPRDTDPHGTRAALHLLEERGLTTRTIATEAELTAALAEPGTTVVVPFTAPMPSRQLVQLGRQHRGSDSRLVLIGPDRNALAAITPDITLVTAPDGEPLYRDPLATDPGCALPEATRADRAELGGLLYDPGPTDVGCYAVSGHPTLVRHTDPGSREIVVLGSARALTNDRLDEQGNASLALGLLGSRRQLVWYLPDYSNLPAGQEPKSLTDFIPAGWNWAAVQLGIAALLTALWRARRLGPVVTEDLPVVVRAAETTEGRARLYHRAKARGRAADALRRAARHRIATALGMPLSTGEPEPTALCAAVADRVRQPATDLHALLYGAAPTDDAALLRLTDQLDALERQVRQP